ncbi:26324_t:CDS:1, partial [Dentiscutata erythropus]
EDKNKLKEEYIRMQQEQQRIEGPSIITEYNKEPIEIGINQESDSLYLRPVTSRPGTP